MSLPDCWPRSMIIVLFAVLPLTLPTLTIVRATDIIAITVLCTVILLLLSGKISELQFSILSLGFVLFSIFILTTVLRVLLINPSEVQFLIRNITEAARPLRFIIILTAVASVISTARHRALFGRYLLLATLATSFFEIIQLLNLAVNGRDAAVFAQYYTTAFHIRDAAVNLRGFGVANNPNVFAMLVTPGIIYSIIIILNNNKFDGTTKKIAPYTVLLGGTAFLSTQSRTGLVALLAGLTIALLTHYRFTPKVVFIIGGCLTMIGGGVVLLAWTGIIDQRYLVLVNPLQADTLQLRFQKWKILFTERQTEHYSILIGNGPIESNLSDFHVDGEWVLLLYRYGIFGTAFYLVLQLAILRKLNILAKGRKRVERCLTSVATGFLVSGLVYSITASIYHSLHLFTLLAVLVGATLKSNKNFIRVVVD